MGQVAFYNKTYWARSICLCIWCHFCPVFVGCRGNSVDVEWTGRSKPDAPRTGRDLCRFTTLQRICHQSGCHCHSPLEWHRPWSPTPPESQWQSESVSVWACLPACLCVYMSTCIYDYECVCCMSVFPPSMCICAYACKCLWVCLHICNVGKCVVGCLLFVSFPSIHGKAESSLLSKHSLFLPSLSLPLLPLVSPHTLIIVNICSNWEQFSFPCSTITFSWPFAHTTDTRYHTTHYIYKFSRVFKSLCVYFYMLMCI